MTGWAAQPGGTMYKVHLDGYNHTALPYRPAAKGHGTSSFTLTTTVIWSRSGSVTGRLYSRNSALLAT